MAFLVLCINEDCTPEYAMGFLSLCIHEDGTPEYGLGFLSLSQCVHI